MKISQIKPNNYFIQNKNITKPQNNIKNYFFLKNINNADTVSFKGDEFSLNNSEYSDDESYSKDDETSSCYKDIEVYFARQALYLDEQEWKKFVYKDRNKLLNKKIKFIGYENSDVLTLILRAELALCSLYLSEGLICGYQYLNNKFKSKKWVEKIDLLRTEILNAQAEEKAVELKKNALKKQREKEQLNETNNVKEEKLYPQLLNLIQREKEGKKTKIPNCVMLSNPDEKINKELIKWCGENVNGQFITTDPYQEDLIAVLEKAEEKYQETGDWNLIYVKDMDELIDPNYSDDDDIATMKDLMTCCAEEFHSTLIFSAPHPEELDDIAIAPHRVKKIDTSNIKPATEANIDDAKERLNDEEYKNKTPISAINDILFLLGADKDMFLTLDVLPSDLEKVKNYITENSPEEANYPDLFNEISPQIWYCKDVEIDPPSKRTPHGLDKVLGMDKLKEELVNSVIKPLNDPDYNMYNVDAVNGIMLYGPPGCGKTYIIKALAEELGRYYIEIKPSDVGSIYINGTSNNISEKFKEAKNNAPSVIFIDEIESLAPSRENLRGDDNDTNKCVTELLTNFNEAKNNGIFIICASNEPQKIDKAIKRSGRLDKKIYVPQPDVETRKAFIKDKLSRIKAEGVDVDVDLIAQNTEYFTAEDIKNLMQTASINAINDGIPLNTEHLLNAIKEYKPDLNEYIVERYRLKGDI